MLGWLVRVTAVLVVLGILAFDVFSLAYTNVTTVDDATIVATTGAQVLMQTPRAYDEARATSVSAAQALGVTLSDKDWWVDESGEVHVTVSRTATSIALHYVPQLRKYLTVRAVGTAAAG